MMKSKQDCYLDATSLIAFFLPNHSDYEGSRKKMVELFENYKTLLISWLSLDETMYKICTISNKQKPKGQKKKRPKDFYNLYVNMLNLILSNPIMKIIQFENNHIQGTKNAIENILNYDLNPHDAFHYAIMQDLNVNCIVTKDKDFEKTGVNVISF